MKLHPIAVCVLALCAASTAVAGERTRTGRYHTDKSEGTFQQTTDRAPGKLTRSTTWQNEKGSGQAQMSRTHDAQTGLTQTQRSVTRADGKTASAQHSSQRNADGSVSLQGTNTDFQGRTTTMQGNVSAANADGSRNVHVERSRSDGKSMTTDSTVTRTAQGRSVTGTYQTGDGKSGTYASQSSRTATGHDTSQTYTNAQGQTVTRDISVARTDGGATRTVTVTGPDGQTHTRSGAVAVDKPGSGN